jgi:hypothetical protein
MGGKSVWEFYRDEKTWLRARTRLQNEIGILDLRVGSFPLSDILAGAFTHRRERRAAARAARGSGARERGGEESCS